MTSICSIPECGKKRVAQGFCATHRYRFKKFGDPHTVPKRPTFMLNFIEFAASYEADDCLIWPFHRGDNGYGLLGVGGKTRSAHRMVCEAVHGTAPANNVARHSCGNGKKGCVSGAHLSWGTPKDNSQDMVLQGRSLRGSQNPSSSLDEVKVLNIAAILADETDSQISRTYGVSSGAIWRIRTGRNWSWLTGIKKRA